MGTLREKIDVKCPSYYLIHHAERYFTVHRRGQTPGTLSLTVDMPKVGLPGKVQACHEVRMRYEISEGADGHGLINLTWDPDDRFVPRFAGTLSGESLQDGNSRLTLAGKYDPPLGPVGAVFDGILVTGLLRPQLTPSCTTLSNSSNRIIKWRRLRRLPRLRKNKQHRAPCWLTSVSSGDAEAAST